MKTLIAFCFAALFCVSGYAQTEVYFVHNDHLATPKVVTDSAQNVVWEADYYPFGDVANSIGSLNQPIRFPGQYNDPETGYFYNYYRDYDPTLGRYIQSDPRGVLLDFSDPQRQIATQIGVPVPTRPQAGLNHVYGYVDQNPVTGIDPTGEANPIVLVVLVASYAGYSVWKKIVKQEECQLVCEEDHKKECSDGNTNGLTSCKNDCVMKTWSYTFKRAPLPKRM